MYFESLPLQEMRVIQIKCRITQNFSAKTAINFEVKWKIAKIKAGRQNVITYHSIDILFTESKTPIYSI